MPSCAYRRGPDGVYGHVVPGISFATVRTNPRMPAWRPRNSPAVLPAAETEEKQMIRPLFCLAHVDGGGVDRRKTSLQMHADEVVPLFLAHIKIMRSRKIPRHGRRCPVCQRRREPSGIMSCHLHRWPTGHSWLHARPPASLYLLQDGIRRRLDPASSRQIRPPHS